jgi:hypothetical protein
VNKESDSIWNKFEALTGKKMFPGALNAAKQDDLVLASKYAALKMPPKSTVFINIHPTKFFLKKLPGNYDKKFTELFLGENWIIYKTVNFFNIDYLESNFLGYVAKNLSGKRYDTNREVRNFKQWNIDREFALERYNMFLSAELNNNFDNDVKILSTISDIFTSKNIKPIFVLTSLNIDEIHTFSSNDKAKEIISRIMVVHKRTVLYLKQIGTSYIDLYGYIPTNCFADLIHTNACGDEIVAKSLAKYIQHSNQQ